VSAPVICGTASGGFPSAFVRPIVKLFTSWSDTTPTHIAGAPSWLAPIRRADHSPMELSGDCRQLAAHCRRLAVNYGRRAHAGAAGLDGADVDKARRRDGTASVPLLFSYGTQALSIWPHNNGTRKGSPSANVTTAKVNMSIMAISLRDWLGAVVMIDTRGRQIPMTHLTGAKDFSGR
jgi:hypothetical protein